MDWIIWMDLAVCRWRCRVSTDCIYERRMDMTESTKDNHFAIQTFSISRRFGNFVAVDGIDLSIKEGELFSLL